MEVEITKWPPSGENKCPQAAKVQKRTFQEIDEDEEEEEEGEGGEESEESEESGEGEADEGINQHPCERCQRGRRCLPPMQKEQVQMHVLEGDQGEEVSGGG